jgi:hypothetical protein
VKSVYELTHFRSSKSPGLIDALKLYVDYTEPALRTDSKEIMYCIDHWNDLYEDPFYVLGFYLNNQIIGFTELAFFRMEKLVIVDYMVIHEAYRKNNTFYQFLEDIRQFLRSQQIEFNYIIGEVACYNEELEPPESSKLMIRLLKMSRFGVVKCNYYVPRVGMYDLESAMRSIMMLYTQNEIRQLKRETFFQIVEAVYFKYYQRWHNIFADEMERFNYDKELKSLLDKLHKQLEGKESIDINGLNGLFPVESININDERGGRLIKAATGVVLFFVTFALVSLAYNALKAKLGWDSDTFGIVTTVTFGVTIFLIAVFFERKSSTFSRLLEKFINFFS